MGRVYKDIDLLPTGIASEEITDGCLVLEGGAWRGLYTVGVLDAMMENDINLKTVIGISAGALSAIGYVSGQIGWGARIDLTYRHDGRYCGLRSFFSEKSITGFRYLYKNILRELPLDKKRLNKPNRRLLVGATNMLTGRIHYFEKGACNLSRAIQASATVPYLSRPVVIDGVPYMDGGCSEKIPYTRAKENGEKKIVVVRTRERKFRRKEKEADILTRQMYKDYPAFVDSISHTNEKFNRMADEMDEREAAGEIFVVAPSEVVTVSRFEGDMDKLGDLYWLGYRDMLARVDELKEYLHK
ncbi:MAG TPA: patatin family protein [Lachnospiraceae bacterium]|nr:patatin family protein [Lachnospiraceae bacterium]